MMGNNNNNYNNNNNKPRANSMADMSDAVDKSDSGEQRFILGVLFLSFLYDSFFIVNNNNNCKKVPGRPGVQEAEQDKVKAQVMKLLDMPDNKYCADCGADCPEWASINLGIIIN